MAIASPPSPSFCVISDGIKLYKDKIKRSAGGCLSEKGKIIKGTSEVEGEM